MKSMAMCSTSTTESSAILANLDGLTVLIFNFLAYGPLCFAILLLTRFNGSIEHFRDIYVHLAPGNLNRGVNKVAAENGSLKRASAYTVSIRIALSGRGKGQYRLKKTKGAGRGVRLVGTRSRGRGITRVVSRFMQAFGERLSRNSKLSLRVPYAVEGTFPRPLAKGFVKLEVKRASLGAIGMDDLRKSKNFHLVGGTMVKLGTISRLERDRGARLVYVGGLIKDYNEGLTNLFGELLASVCACMARILGVCFAILEMCCHLRKEENLLRLGTKKKLKRDQKDMDYEMSYVRVKDKDDRVSDDDEDEDTKPSLIIIVMSFIDIFEGWIREIRRFHINDVLRDVKVTCATFMLGKSYPDCYYEHEVEFTNNVLLGIARYLKTMSDAL
ncbi:hypothetical protein FNV43_RR07332 [Rhamnella rubrinervis]|uniref:Uncharacterized protein n=1 Tax=Rhamnella rubrinervis TaxID=2594499 RepID=A0A8K0MM95_9ROSA|nr:hypothetical protein FNV43_RR07332 [Rhamnella rubrinervis]